MQMYSLLLYYIFHLFMHFNSLVAKLGNGLGLKRCHNKALDKLILAYDKQMDKCINWQNTT